MPASPLTWRTALALSVALVTGCATGVIPSVGPVRKPSTPSTRATVKPEAALITPLLVPQRGARIVTLTGQAAIISNNGGSIISDNGGAIISNNAGAIISDSGGAIISNNSGGIIANNGGGLVNQAAYRVQQTASNLAVYKLADAALTFQNAAGRTLVDETGKPLTAKTRADGTYSFSGALPVGNVVARVKLWNGGELQAMVVRGDAESLKLDLDTASTMGTAYVLGQYVKKNQAIFDKLPRAEAERLTRDLDVVRRYVTGAFQYDAALLTQATDALRQKESAVDKTLDDVKALLLGQSALGSGLAATQVPLGSPTGLLIDQQGRLVIGEDFSGRLRLVDAQGTLQTFADAIFGTVKRNFLGLLDVAEMPDGSLIVTTKLGNLVQRITAAGTITTLASTGANTRGPVTTPLATDMEPGRLAVGDDGTVYIGEWRGLNATLDFARVFAVAPTGTLQQIPLMPDTVGDVLGLATGPGGVVYALTGSQSDTHDGVIQQIAPGPPRVVVSGLMLGSLSKLSRRESDGMLFYSEPALGRVMSVLPTGGTPTVVAGTGGPEATRALIAPGSITTGLGAVYVGDHATNLVYRVTPDGQMAALAGTQGASQAGDLTSFALNAPGGASFDDQGNLYMAEGGSHTIKRFDGKSLTVVAGTTRGFSGDNGPATLAQLNAPTAVIWDAGKLWVLDNGNGRLRLIAADGTITTKAGTTEDEALKTLAPGAQVPALTFRPPNMIGMTLDPTGRPLISSGIRHQIFRFNPGAAGQPDMMEGLVGREQAESAEASGQDIMGTTETDAHKIALRFPLGAAFDPLTSPPTLCFSEASTFHVRRVLGLDGATPTVATIAGLSLLEGAALAATFPEGSEPPSGNGENALQVFFAIPMGIAFDKAGNLYVAEAGTASLPSIAPLLGGKVPFDPALLPVLPARVRRIARDGTVTNIAGPGGRYFTDPTAPDALVIPTALAIAPDGRLAIIDTGANQVRILPAAGLQP